jgi:hypothetical protein
MPSSQVVFRVQYSPAWHDLKAAMNRGIAEIIWSVRRLMLSRNDQDPLVVYTVASDVGWASDPEQIARCVAEHDIADLYVPEMEDMPAWMYRRMLEFQHRYVYAVQDVIKRSAAVDLHHILSTTKTLAVSDAIALALIQSVMQDTCKLPPSTSQCRCCNTYFRFLPDAANCGYTRNLFLKGGISALSKLEEPVKKDVKTEVLKVC